MASESRAQEKTSMEASKTFKMTQTDAPPADLEKIRSKTVFVLLLLCAVTFAAIFLVQRHDLSEYFFKSQDLIAFTLAIGFLICAPTLMKRRIGLQRLSAFFQINPIAGVATLCVGVGILGWIGWRLVFGGFALSEDEFMALFDSEIFRNGALMAPLSPEWRPFNRALQPDFQIGLPNGAAWSSTYYPINAAALAFMDVIGLRSATGGVWAALSVGLCYRLARKIWPETPTAALVAALLLATSSQLAITAMTTYAMSAHLALNLLWLNLFLNKGKLSQFLALLTAAAATGLHQLVFHPLFAAPFIAQLWLNRQFKRASFHTVGYLMIGLLWTHYWEFALWMTPVDRVGNIGAGMSPIRTAIHQLSQLKADAIQWQLENVFRAITWQNPLAFALFLVGAPLAFRVGGVERNLLFSLVLTFGLVTVFEPYQGHGWGYRYLHGLLGAFAIIAVRGAISIWPTSSEALSRRAVPLVMVSALFSILIMTPVRMAQAYAWSAPYARAHALISRSKADVVILNSNGLAFAEDLVRNDPWLRNQPKVLSLMAMTPPQLSVACNLGKVEIFDREVGAQLGILKFDQLSEDEAVKSKMSQFENLRRSGQCGEAIRTKP